jgi:Domain of unknown function (DUF4365)
MVKGSRGKGRKDFLGQRGEDIFRTQIAEFRGNGWPYFNPIFLGEKNEAFDFLVETVRFESHDPNSSVQPYFFVQVKTTTLGYTHHKECPRLKVRLSEEHIEKIKQFPAPTYLAGVDEPRKQSFIVAIDSRINGAISSISTISPLANELVLKRLWDEVGNYWMRNNIRMTDSSFHN